MRSPVTLLVALGTLTCAARLTAAEPFLIEKPDTFKTLVNPNCSHCIDEAKRRANDLRDDDPVLAWTRGYSDGGAVPLRFFLNPYRVVSDSYAVFVYDPDAGFARGFAPGFTFRFHGWRNGIMVMKDARDGTLYSCLSGVAFAGPKKGHRLATVPTLTTTWGDWLKRYPHAVAYQMFEKYRPTELPTKPHPDSVKSRPATTDPRLNPDEPVLGVRVGDTTRAYPLGAWARSQWYAEFVTDELAGQKVVVMWQTGTKTAAAYKPVAHPPRKYKPPHPDKDGVSPPDPGVPAAPGGPADLQPVELEVVSLKSGPALVTKGGTNADSWDIAGRCQDGRYKGWALEPVDAVQCKWFAWAAEYPETEVYGQVAKKPGPKPGKAMKEVAGAAEFLRVLPKPFATLKGVDPKTRTVSLLIDGEKVAKVWPVEPDAEIKVNGWWGRLEQLKTGQRVWAWLKLNRDRQPVAVAMLADESSEWDLHGRFRTVAKEQFPAAEVEAKRSEQKAWLRKRWESEGLPGAVAFAHVFSGELDVMLDHEAIRWGRGLKTGDVVHLQAGPPIRAVVKSVAPWRERTQVRLVVGELQGADLAAGQRVHLKVPTPSRDVDESPYPPDLGRPRSKAERQEWFLTSTYCVCTVGKDTCTGMFYTLASCNPNGCGAPGALRQQVGELIDAGKTDREIWDLLLKERGELMTKPHLLP
jgi:hypothetical protein